MKKDMDHMNGKVDQILKTITTMAREEGLQQNVAARNAILVFSSASQQTLINPLYGVYPGFYP